MGPRFRLPRVRRPRARSVAAVLGVAVLLAASSLAGMALALRAFSSSTYRIGLGTVDVRVDAATHPQAELYVPLVDWGISARAFSAPVAIRAEVRAVDRDSALVTLRSGADARRQLADARAELPPVVRRAVRRAIAIAVAGALAGAGLAALALAGLTGRRRFALVGLPAGAVAAAVTLVPVALALEHVRLNAFEHPTFHAHGAELPRLLAFSAQLSGASKGYTESYEMALRGLANLASATSADRPEGAGTHEILVASDIHSNTLPLAAFGRYAEGKPIFLVGDFTELGTPYEDAVVHAVAALGKTVVAVSGNHDTLPLMRRLAQAGVIVLRSGGVLKPDGSLGTGAVVPIDGIPVAGYSDPLETRTDTIGVHPLELQGSAFTDEQRRVVSWFDELPSRPKLVLIHQHGLAHALLRHVASDGGAPVTILTGHDHVQHIEREGTSLLVDGGTLGAGGIFAIGEQPAGFVDLRLDDAFDPVSADLIDIEPVSGDGNARRVVFDPKRTTGTQRWDPVPRAPASSSSAPVQPETSPRLAGR
jgi:predicted phosphodiesterase